MGSSFQDGGGEVAVSKGSGKANLGEMQILEEAVCVHRLLHWISGTHHPVLSSHGARSLTNNCQASTSTALHKHLVGRKRALLKKTKKKTLSAH